MIQQVQKKTDLCRICRSPLDLPKENRAQRSRPTSFGSLNTFAQGQKQSIARLLPGVYSVVLPKQNPAQRPRPTSFGYIQNKIKAVDLCSQCIPKEMAKQKKHLKDSGIIGIILMLFFWGLMYYIRRTGFVSDTSEYGGTAFIPFLSGYITIKSSALFAVTDLSLINSILMTLFCFAFPFGIFIPMDFNTHRRDAEVNIYKMEPLSGNMIAHSENHRLDDVGAFILSLIIFILSVPFALGYKIYKLVQLQKYMKKLKQ